MGANVSSSSTKDSTDASTGASYVSSTASSTGTSGISTGASTTASMGTSTEGMLVFSTASSTRTSAGASTGVSTTASTGASIGASTETSTGAATGTSTGASTGSSAVSSKTASLSCICSASTGSGGGGGAATSGIRTSTASLTKVNCFFKTVNPFAKAVLSLACNSSSISPAIYWISELARNISKVLICFSKSSTLEARFSARTFWRISMSEITLHSSLSSESCVDAEILPELKRSSRACFFFLANSKSLLIFSKEYFHEIKF